MTLSRMFEQLNRFRTADLLRVIRREEDIPRFEKLFNDYQLGRLWDHLPAVLFFYAVFAVASGVGRLLASWLLRERLAKMDAKAQYKVKVSWAHHVVAFTNALLTSCMTVCEIYRSWNRPLAVGTHEYYPQVARLLSIGVGYTRKAQHTTVIEGVAILFGTCSFASNTTRSMARASHCTPSWPLWRCSSPFDRT